MRYILLFLLFSFPALAADPAWQHGLTVWGTLKYPPGFAHFDYVNPDAPQGGELKLAATSSFDSVNPFIVKGNKAPGASTVFESLLVNSLDEPQSMYGLIAEKVALSPDRTTADFLLRAEARFHDGSPITADDVVFSFNTLKKDGDPTYRIAYAPVASATAIDARHVRFIFSDTTRRELPLIVGSMPILSKAYYTAHEFNKTTLTPPLASGPYEITDVNQGRSITFTRVKNYWGDRLPVNIGQNNFASMRYDLYRDETVALEAIKAGEYDFREENVARAWATGYDCPAVQDGRLIKQIYPNKIPQGMQAFAFNTRRARFADRRVREAIGLTLDFEWMNKALFFGAYKRDKSFFLNTAYAAPPMPDAAEIALLAPFRDDLPPGILTQPFELPVTDGSGNDRPQLIKADKLLTDAGWIIRDGVRVNAKTGEKLTFEFLLQSAMFERVASPMRKHLKQLGIDATIRIVDDAQYIKRVETFDYDVMLSVFNRGVFFPGNEQQFYWQASEADQPGSENLAGVKNKVVDALVARIIAAKSEPELRAAAHALDRVLLWENYVIPHWNISAFRLIYSRKIGMPRIWPDYSLGLGTWWIKPDK